MRHLLGSADHAWLVQRLSRRIERGTPLTGTLTLAGATAGQRAAAARLLGRPAGRGSALSISLQRLEEELQDAGVAPDLRTAIELLTGPLADLAGERAGEQERRAAALEALRRCPHRDEPWYEAWVEGLSADGTLTRLARRGDHRLAGQAAAVLGRLPGDTIPLPVLAEAATGDTKALSGTALATLVLRALALRSGAPSTALGSAGNRRLLWESAGVILDDLASQVLVLNLRCHEEHVVADWLREAADFGIPFRLTLHQLMAEPLTALGPELYVCENPAVLRVAASELAGGCKPLVCTEGQPSAACDRVLRRAVEAGVRVHWRGDFDWTGLRSTTVAVQKYAAVPWRMGAADYDDARGDAWPGGIDQRDGDQDGAGGDAQGAPAEVLRGAPADSPWDEALARRMLLTGRAVMEERLIPALLPDLRR